MDDDTYAFSRPIRRVTSLNPVDSYLTGSWEALGNGAPILVALAQICSQAMIDQPPEPSLDDLIPEAKAILFSAAVYGVIEVKGLHTAFEASSRLVAVYVEDREGRTIAFRDAADPRVTVQFLEGFRQLCLWGLIIHHLHRDFSLSPRGFALAERISQSEVQPWLDKATEFGLHD